jgi:hypothetical protein
VTAWVYVIEFQKRGLPHIHAIFTLDKRDKWRTAEDVDKHIRAYMDPDDDEELTGLITRFMLHGPCGAANPQCPCMMAGKDGRRYCSKKFPKSFSDVTKLTEDGYCELKRPK